MYDFLYSITTHTNRLDIYGISADSFNSKEEFKEYPMKSNITPSHLTSPPLSLSSLTLHTISISSPEHSPRDYYHEQQNDDDDIDEINNEEYPYPYQYNRHSPVGYSFAHSPLFFLFLFFYDQL